MDLRDKASYDQALKLFFVVNVLYMLGGLGIIYPIYSLDNIRKDQINNIMLIYSIDANVPAYLMYSSACIICVNGILGIISIYFDSTYLMDSHEGFSYVSLGLSLVTSVAATSILSRPSVDKFENLLHAEAYHLSKHTEFKNICLGHIWDTIQESLTCCGVLGYRDWSFSQIQAIPRSCCVITNRQKCELGLKELEENRKQNKTLAYNFKSNLVPYLWPRGCMEAFQDVIGQKKFIWTIFSLSLSFIIFIVVSFTTILVDIIRGYTDYYNRRKFASNASSVDILQMVCQKLHDRDSIVFRDTHTPIN